MTKAEDRKGRLEKRRAKKETAKDEDDDDDEEETEKERLKRETRELQSELRRKRKKQQAQAREKKNETKQNVTVKEYGVDDFLKQPKAISLSQAKKKRKSLKMGNILPVRMKKTKKMKYRRDFIFKRKVRIV